MKPICSICNKSFVTVSNYNRHCRIVHEKTNSFRCDICEKVLNQKDNYDRHVRVCKAEFKCLYCDYTFKFSSHRTLHVYKGHKDKLFKCDNCCAEYLEERKHQRHQQTCEV